MQSTAPRTARPEIHTLPAGERMLKDFIASIVVFLIALPLCMGIALAAGVPAAVGIMTGVVGGLVVGALSGAQLQVSGPAAGLVVLIVELGKQHGYDMLGIIIVVAGLLQVVAGLFGLGQWFRAVPPAVVHGMLSGIGLLLIGSQFHVMFDQAAVPHGLMNILNIPQTVVQAFSSGFTESAVAGGLGIATILIGVLWDTFSQGRFKLVPGALLAIIAATAAATLFSLPIKHVAIPNNILSSFRLPDFALLPRLQSSEVLLDALALAFVASAETMLTASALDKMTSLNRTNFDKELKAQGLGNMIAGFLGLLPVTGVIARSGVNVKAGAQTRLSAVLHGVWLVIFVSLLPNVLKLVPTTALAALLVYTGYKLFLSKEAQEIRKYGKSEIAIYGITLGSIVCFDLLTGVLIGVVLSVAKLLYVFSHIIVRVQADDDDKNLVHIYLSGAATFLSLPRLAQKLDELEPGKNVRIHIDRLQYIDHACLDLLKNWEKQYCTGGGGCLTLDRGELDRRYRSGRLSAANAQEAA